jgi:hypothetical protein
MNYLTRLIIAFLAALAVGIITIAICVYYDASDFRTGGIFGITTTKTWDYLMRALKPKVAL